MKNLKELEQKYLELGKEIEALKKQSTEKEEVKYPIFCKLKDSSLVVKFKEFKQGKTVVNNTFNNVGNKYFIWQAINYMKNDYSLKDFNLFKNSLQEALKLI